MERSEKKEAIRRLGPLCAMHAATILLPQRGFEQWAVVACDQYTSQPDYWEETARIVGDAPSTLQLMLSELYLEAPDKPQRIERIHAAMRQYLEDGTLRALSEGAVLVNRGGRLGLVIAFDLEFYDYGAGAQPLIRATEGTIVERIPPRQEVRRGAALELPHILILLDDPGKTVIEPLLDDPLAKLYDFELMQGGGHITGHFVPLESLSALEVPLQELLSQAADAMLPQQRPMLYAVGDGNHSLATAKAHWEDVKRGLSEQQRLEHPARYALCELVNLHNDKIVFEPIHRLLTGAPGAFAALDELSRRIFGDDRPQSVTCVTADGEQQLRLGGGKLPVAALDEVLEAYRAERGGAIDYIHGDGVLRELGTKPGAAGFLLEGMRKQDLFEAVALHGALPKKTFSMGDARDKRYYLECRVIDPAAPKAKPFELD